MPLAIYLIFNLKKNQTTTPVAQFRLRGYVGINLELIFNSGARRAKLSHHDVTPESRISDELGDSAPDIGARGSFHVFGGIFELPCFIL